MSSVSRLAGSNGSNGGGTAGQLKPFKQPSRMDEVQATSILDDLRAAIRHIHASNASSLSFEELYRNAYKLVLHKHGELLYRGVEQEVTDHASRLGAAVARASDDVLLADLVRRWELHKTTMTMIRDILMYMDRTYVMSERKTPVYDMGLRVFRDQVERHAKVRPRLRQALQDAVAAERRGELADRPLLRSVLRMLMELGTGKRTVYEQDFEEDLLSATRTFMEGAARERMAVSTCAEYLREAEKALNAERERARDYMDTDTEPKLSALCAEELVGRYADQLVKQPGSGLAAMLRDDKLEDVARMYRLFEHRNCRDPMRDCLAEFVRESGVKLLAPPDAAVPAAAAAASAVSGGKPAAGASGAATSGERKPVDIVRDLLALQTKCETLLREALDDDKSFLKAVRGAFETFMNKDHRCAEYLSLYLDDLLRNRLRDQAATESEVTAKVDAVVTLFRHFHDKDVFESFYKRHLAKRLLSGRSVSSDAETSVIKKLRLECGQAFTVKLENMFKDVKLSRETMDRYRNARRAGLPEAQPTKPGGGLAAAARQQQQQEPELEVKVLTSGLWPTEQAPPCELPVALSGVCDAFRRFYMSYHEGRRLTWQTNQGSADVKFILPQGRTHELTVSTYQMLVLVLFNGDNRGDAPKELTFKDLLDATQVPPAELRRHLISLTAPRYKVLLKDSPRAEVEDDTVFSVNEDFSSKHYKVRVQLVSARVGDGGSGGPGSAAGSVPEQVEEDRKHLVEAAIVRIMKARKTLDMNQLVAEVVRQMAARFRPSPQQIKQRVESLIDREYLERDETDHRQFHYVA